MATKTPQTPEPTAQTRIQTRPSNPAYAWKSAYVSLGLMFVAAILGAGFFALGGLFGPSSDAAAALFGLSLAPLVWALSRTTEDAAPRASRIVAALGFVGVSVMVLGSLGLVVGALGVSLVSPAWSLGVQFGGTWILGDWLVASGVLGIRTETVSRRISLASILAGVSFVTFPVNAAVLGFSSPLLYLGITVGVLAFVVWAYWLGREFRSRAATL